VRCLNDRHLCFDFLRDCVRVLGDLAVALEFLVDEVLEGFHAIGLLPVVALGAVRRRADEEADVQLAIVVTVFNGKLKSFDVNQLGRKLWCAMYGPAANHAPTKMIHTTMFCHVPMA
jgi:hypothetical protein